MKKILAFAIALATVFAVTPANALPANLGMDVSYPQCGSTLPSSSAIKVIGVNGGRAFDAYDNTTCLASLLRWGGESAQLYANTGNPGTVSSNWPLGATSPRVCSANAASADTEDCAYVYGYRAAQYSLNLAQTTFNTVGFRSSPTEKFWWLDVETMNSWRLGSGETLPLATRQQFNTAVLHGEVDALLAAGVTQIGFYSTRFQWGQITGGTTDFAAYPSWGAFGTMEDPSTARDGCSYGTPGSNGFTGGPLVKAQFNLKLDPERDITSIDYNFECNNLDPADAFRSQLSYVGATWAKKGKKVTMKAKLLAFNGQPYVGRSIAFRINGKKFLARTDSNGVASRTITAPKKKGWYKVSVGFTGLGPLTTNSTAATLKVKK